MNKVIQYWKKTPVAARSSIAFAGSLLLIKGITFLTTPVFTRILDSEQYGIVATYHSWVSILEVFALLGMTSAGVFNVGLKEHKEDRSQFISSSLFLCNLTTVAVFLILVLLKIPFGRDFILPYPLLAIMFIHFILNPAQIFWMTRQRYEYKYKAAFLVSLLSSLISQVVAVISVIKLSHAGVPLSEVKIWSTNLTLIFFELPIYVLLFQKGRAFFRADIWRNMLRFAIPLLPHYLAQHIMSSSDRIMISNLNSATGAAIYSVVANISMITTIIWSSVNASLIPYTFESLEHKESNNINRIVIPILAFYSVLCIGVTLIAPEVIQILAPPEYYGGIYAVPPIAATAFLTALYNIYANIEFYHKKSSWIAFATIVSSCTNVGLNYMLIPKYGYVAAAYTTLISHMVLIIMHYIGYRRCQKTGIYHDKMIFFICVITIVSCFICNLLYLNRYIRYFVLLIIVTTIVIKRNYFISKLKWLKKTDHKKMSG